MLVDIRHDADRRDKRIRSYLEDQKLYDTSAAFFGSLGWLFETIQCYIYYSQISESVLMTTILHTLIGKTTTFTSLEITYENQNESTALTYLRIIVSVSTVALLFCIYKSYMIEYKILVLRGDFYAKLVHGPNYTPSEVSVKQRLVLYMLLEMLYLSIHSLPFVNINIQIGMQGYWLEYSLDLVIAVVMQGRVYLIFRLLAYYSAWMSPDAVAVCKSQGAQGGFWFGCKALIKERPIIFVMATIVGFSLIGSIGTMLFERPFMYTTNIGWANYVNSLWCVFSAIAAVGYGDFYFGTDFGRSVGFVIVIAGQFLTSLMVTTITAIVSFSKSEENAYYRIKDITLRADYHKMCKKAIKHALLYFVDTKIRKKKTDYNKHYTKLHLNLNQCRNLRRALELEEVTQPFNFLLEFKKLSLTDKKFDVIRAVRKVEAMILRLDTLERNNEHIEEILSSLKYSNNLMLRALKAVKRDSTVEKPFDGLVAHPQALRHIDKLKKVAKPLWQAPIETQVSLTELKEERSPSNFSSNLDKKQLKRRLARRITNAQTLVDKDLLKLTSDKSMPALTFNEKRELVTILDVKEHLQTYMELKNKQDLNKSVKRAYVSGPQLMNKLRKKARLVQVALRARSQSLKNTMVPALEEHYSVSTIKEDSRSEQESSSLFRTDQTSTTQTGYNENNLVKPLKRVSFPNVMHDQRLFEEEDPRSMDLLDLLEEENEDSGLGSDLDPDAEEDADSSDEVIQDASPSIYPVENRQRKSALKPSKYGGKDGVKPEERESITKKNTILSFAGVSQEMIIGMDRTSGGYAKSEEEIKELETITNIMNQGNREREISPEESKSNIKEFNRVLDELDNEEKAKADRFGIRGSSMMHKSRSEFSILNKPPMMTSTLDNSMLPEKQQLSSRKAAPGIRVIEREETMTYGDTNATLITKETQENELFTKDVGEMDASRWFRTLDNDLIAIKRTSSTVTQERSAEDAGASPMFNMYKRGQEGEDQVKKDELSTGLKVEQGRFSRYSLRMMNNMNNQATNSPEVSSPALSLRRNHSSLMVSTKKIMNLESKNGSELDLSPALRRQVIADSTKDSPTLTQSGSESNHSQSQGQGQGRINLLKVGGLGMLGGGSGGLHGNTRGVGLQSSPFKAIFSYFKKNK